MVYFWLGLSVHLFCGSVLAQDFPARYPLAGGHTRNDSSKYDIWSDECHNAANAFLEESNPQNNFRGIVSCNQDLPIHSQEGHTFNWEISKAEDPKKELVCLHNWTANECWYQTKSENHLPSPVNQHVINWIIGQCAHQAKHKSDIKFFKAGVRVAQAGPHACVREVRGLPPNSISLQPKTPDKPGSRKKCNSCCVQKSNIWLAESPKDAIGDGLPQTPEKKEALRNNYIDSCEAACTDTFGPRRKIAGTVNANNISGLYCTSESGFTAPMCEAYIKSYLETALNCSNVVVACSPFDGWKSSCPLVMSSNCRGKPALGCAQDEVTRTISWENIKKLSICEKTGDIKPLDPRSAYGD